MLIRLLVAVLLLHHIEGVCKPFAVIEAATSKLVDGILRRNPDQAAHRAARARAEATERALAARTDAAALAARMAATDRALAARNDATQRALGSMPVHHHDAPTVIHAEAVVIESTTRPEARRPAGAITSTVSDWPADSSLLTPEQIARGCANAKEQSR